MSHVRLELALWQWSIVALILLLAACATHDVPVLRDGDLVFQTSLSQQGEAIARATGSPYTHVGVVFLDDGEPIVLEAIGPVVYTPLDEWIIRGKNSHFVVKRLADSLDSWDIAALRRTGERYLGRRYDFYFEWTDQRMYCSELVWKMYSQAMGVRIGELQRLQSFNLSDPLVAQKLRERYANSLPLEERVISPAAMFESDLLRTVED